MLKLLYKKENFIKNFDGQATVEAALIIPIIFILMLLLIQPGIILYDLCIMNSAASETCRVLSTSDDENISKICEPFIRRRLSGIPQQDNFHVHSDGCSYEFEFNGNQNSELVSVQIKNEVKPLPLIGFLSNIFGILNANNCFEIIATSEQKLKPSWTINSPYGNNPEKWVGGWL